MSEKKFKTWLEIADEDLETAICCFNNNRFMWSVVMCQQAIEKVLKAIYVKNIGKIPEKTHNLVKLAKDTGIIEELSEETINLLEDLLIYYYNSRYPDRWNKLKSDFNREFINSTLKHTQEVHSWLKSKL